MTDQHAPEGPERALQALVPVALPPEMCRVAVDILTGGLSVTGAVDAAIALLATTPGVTRVYATSTLLQPDRPESWVRLGERAWLKEWLAPGATPSLPPEADAGPEQAMSLPWFSQQVRRQGVAVLVDASLLDGPAEQDRIELLNDGSRAAVGSSMICDGVMYGGLGMDRDQPGRWPDEYIAAIRLVSAALASRMSAERSRSALADAIERGDHARDSQQQFFSALGHELRTPITAIVVTAEMLAAEASEVSEASAPQGRTASGSRPVRDVTAYAAGVAGDAAVVLSASEHLLAIVNDLLRTGQELGVGIESQAVDVADAVGDVIHWLRAPALAADVTVSCDVPPQTLVSTTPSGLRQILSNLVANAVAYNHRGGRVHVTTVHATGMSGDARVRITVHDTGPGLTREQQVEIFKPFVRFVGPEVPGTGLGLSLSRSLAERDG